jgi:plastocyanin
MTGGMKLDITKLPVVEGVVAFLIVTIGITFAAAFAATDGGGSGEAVSESPAPPETGSPGPRPSPGGPIVVTMQDNPNSFEPDEITVRAGSTAIFEITNDGSAIHNLHIAGPEGDYTEDFCRGGGDPCSDPGQVRGGETATLTWPVPPDPGEVDFRCDFHPSDMTGTITIE